MPQIRCPNCGATINLENRRKLDYHLILKAVQKKPKTFTDLLHTTHLPRKTLSLRLKSLRKSQAIRKENGSYCLNEPLPPDMEGEIMSAFNELTKSFWTNKRNLFLFLLLLCIGLPVATRVSAMIFYSSAPAEPMFYGSLRVNITAHEVVDLYAWQTEIVFDSNDMCGAVFKTGDSFNVGYPFFVNATDIGDGVLLLGATLKGNTPGLTGSGTLATITFKIKTEDAPDNPKILFNGKTWLFDSNLEPMENVKELLTLE